MSRALDPNATNVQVDALALAHGRAKWEAEFRTRRFPRLTGVAVSDVPTARVQLEFTLLDNRPVIHGTLRGEVELICQRCMGRTQQPIEEVFDLMLVDDEAEMDAVPESHEPWLMHTGLIDVAEVVEEQLLLALPIIARHSDENECVTTQPLAMPPAKQREPASSASSDVPDTQRPFANLRDLLRK